MLAGPKDNGSIEHDHKRYLEAFCGGEYCAEDGKHAQLCIEVAGWSKKSRAEGLLA